MTEYIPVLIWLLSGGVCLLIEQRRSLKRSAFRPIMVTLLGPLAIPFVLLARPDQAHRA